MTALEYLLLAGLVITAVAAPLCRRMLATVIVYMAFSLLMAVLWSLLQSPDLAITEAAVGAGITSLLLFLTLRRLNLIDQDEEHRKHEEETIRQHAALHEERGEEEIHE